MLVRRGAGALAFSIASASFGNSIVAHVDGLHGTRAQLDSSSPGFMFLVFVFGLLNTRTHKLSGAMSVRKVSYRAPFCMAAVLTGHLETELGGCRDLLSKLPPVDRGECHASFGARSGDGGPPLKSFAWAEL